MMIAELRVILAAGGGYSSGLAVTKFGGSHGLFGRAGGGHGRLYGFANVAAVGSGVWFSWPEVEGGPLPAPQAVLDAPELAGDFAMPTRAMPFHSAP
jgi:hypothetical protein